MNHYETLIKIRDAHITLGGSFEDIKALDSILAMMEEQPPVFFLTEEDATHLWDYFHLRAGFISYETDIPVHKFCDRLYSWLKTRNLV